MDIIPPLKGVIRIFEIPDDWTEAEVLYWLKPETAMIDGQLRTIRPARMSEEEKQRRLRLEVENLLTVAGMGSILTSIGGANQSQLLPFAQIFSVGNGAILGPTRAATAVAGDGFATGSRKVPLSFWVQSTLPAGFGFLLTRNGPITVEGVITTVFASPDALGTWTNCGLYGYNPNAAQDATTTPGTGQLNSLALLNYTKGNTAHVVQYSFVPSN